MLSMLLNIHFLCRDYFVIYFLLALVLGLPNIGNTANILIDWSNDGTISSPAGDGKYWNTLGTASTTADMTGTALVDASNATTGFSVAVDFSATLTGFGVTAINGPTGTDPFDEANAVIDGVYSNEVGNSVYTITGLQPSETYHFSLIGGRSSSGIDGVIKVTQGTPDGNAVDNDVQDSDDLLDSYILDNIGTILSFSVISTSGGIIELKFFESVSGSNGLTATFNALNFSGNIDTTAPVHSSLDPVNGAIDIGGDSSFAISFSKNINAGSGCILIKEVAGDVTHESITVSDTSRITFNTNTMTISPSSILSISTNYYIFIPSGAVEDSVGNPFSGFTTSSNWAFTSSSSPPYIGIYEPFDYAAGDVDGVTQNGGLGMDGAWSTSGSQHQYDIQSSGLTFTDYNTSGNMVQRPSYQGDAEVHREISDYNKSQLLNDDTTIWFSVLMRDAHYYDNHAADAFLLSTGKITGTGTKPVTIAGGEGLGVSFKEGATNDAGMDVHGIVIDGGTTNRSTGFIDDPIGTENITYLIVGKIRWASNGNNDNLKLFNITDALRLRAPTDSEAFADMDYDLDQSQFDTIAIGTAQRGKFDEIRFATDFFSVLGRDPPPPGTIIKIE